MTKTKKNHQAEVQGEVVHGHIELNGQGNGPSHKSVKPVRAEDVIPGSYKKALLKDMAQRFKSPEGRSLKSMGSLGFPKLKLSSKKKVDSNKSSRDREVQQKAPSDEVEQQPSSSSESSPESRAGESATGRGPSGAPPAAPMEVTSDVLEAAVHRLADLVVPVDGNASARAHAEAQVRLQLKTVLSEKQAQPSDLKEDNARNDLPPDVELLDVGSTPSSAKDLQRSKDLLFSADSRVTAWRAECTTAVAHLMRLLRLPEKQATDLYCGSSAVNGRGIRSVITAIRNYLIEQAPPNGDIARAYPGQFPGPAVPETSEFLAKHPVVRVDGFGFRHSPWTGEIFAVASEDPIGDSFTRTWAPVGLWGVTELEGGMILTDWLVPPESRFVVHQLRSSDDLTEYAALFGDAALPRYTVQERRIETRRQFEEASRHVDNQGPMSTARKRVTPVQLGPAVNDAVNSVPGLSPVQVAAIVQAIRTLPAPQVTEHTVATAGLAYRIPQFDEAREFQRLVDRELEADDLRNVSVAVRWRKATERANVKWPALAASFRQPVELDDDGRSEESGDSTGKDGGGPGGGPGGGSGGSSGSSSGGSSDDEDDDEEDGDSDSERDSEKSSGDEDGSEDEPDKGRERRREKKRRQKAERDRKAAFNSLGSPVKPKQTGTPSSPFVVVGGSDPTTKLERWTSGRSSNNAGFNWKAYTHHKQLYDAYMDAYGETAPRTFRSIIGPLLIPKVCNDCGLNRSKWKTLSDATIILAIEKKLRPTKSSSFAADLKKIYFETAKDSAAARNGMPEPLGERFALFTEKYLAKVAEAEDAGRPIKERLIMKYFLDQLKDEEDLKDWLAEEKFKTLEYTVKRLTRKLKAHEGWLKGKTTSGGGPSEGASEPSPTSFQRRSTPRGGRMNASTDTNHVEENCQVFQNEDLVVSVASAVEVALRKPLEALVNLMQANDAARINAQQAPASAAKTVAFGSDRGESWHVPSEHVVCYKTPCNAKFCQKCGKHGHVRAECKVPDSDPRANKQGYWCENNKGDALKPIYRENRTPPGNYKFGGPPGGSGRRAAQVNATQGTGGQCL